MTDTGPVRAFTSDRRSVSSSQWIVASTAMALAAAQGIGRFVYTPILPLMLSQAGMSSQVGATVATANYVGYLLGALAGIVAPRLIRSTVVLRLSLILLVASLLLMAASTDSVVWFVLRLIAGAASALVFMIASTAMLTNLGPRQSHLAGWAFGGVGAGIALTGVLVLILRVIGTWGSAWIASGILAAVLSVGAWFLRPDRIPDQPARAVKATYPRTSRWFIALFASYTLEAVGYIIAGTFLIVAIDQTAPGWIGSSAWIIVGLSALPSSALWAWLAFRFSRPVLLIAMLVIQAVGIAVPAWFGGVAPALISAVLFGGTLLGIGVIALAVGTHLRTPRAVAILTAGYSLGQTVGPLIVAPLLSSGYHLALLIGAGIVLLAAIAAGILRIRFPHNVLPIEGALSSRHTPGMAEDPSNQ